MTVLLRFSQAIDRLNRGIGRATAWLTLLMVLMGAFNAVARYLGRWTGVHLSSNAYIELQWYLFSLIFLLGASYALLQDAHVRVDVFSSRLSQRGRDIIDVIGSIVFLLPFCGLALWTAWPMVVASWEVLEQSPDPGGLPRYPIKSAILVGFVLVALQGVSETIKRVARLAGSAP